MSQYNANVRQFDPMASGATARRNPPPPSHPLQPFQAPANPALHPGQIQFLQSQGFSSGMIRNFAQIKDSLPVRIWILDNGSAMNVADAHILRNFQNVNTTRWEELKDCVAYHADFALRFNLPSRYALINNPGNVPQYFSLAQTGNKAQEQAIMNQVLSQTVPNGPTPIATQLRILREYIVSIAPQLHAKKQTVPIILATEGLPTNEAGQSSPETVLEFTNALKSFEPFPVWIVLRMCTDDEKAFEFYNSLDAHLEGVDLDVLDDIYGEALEVFLRNPWLTYGLPLHRFREGGFPVPVLDAIDERALTLPELWQLCAFLFDFLLPDPLASWPAFLRSLESCLSREHQQWNPVTKTWMPWINLSYLNAIYGQRQFSHPAPVSTPTQQYGQAQQQQQPSQQQQQPSFTQQPMFPTPTPIAPTTSVSQPKDTTQLLQAVDRIWAKQPPMFNMIKPIAELLGTVDTTFPLVQPHEYFQSKFHPFAKEALATGDSAVLKRAVRKMRLFLHPDKLPKDLSEMQTSLCKALWDNISESWNSSKDKL